MKNHDGGRPENRDADGGVMDVRNQGADCFDGFPPRHSGKRGKPMLNSRQRAALRSMASRMDAIFQIGKGGVGDNMVKSISDALEARELVKISLLENAGDDAREVGNELAKRTGAVLVAVIGRKILLYKQAEKEANRRISREI